MTRDLASDALVNCFAPNNDHLQVREVLRACNVLLQLFVSFQCNNFSFAVIRNVATGIRAVCCVNTSRDTASKNGASIGNEPFVL